MIRVYKAGNHEIWMVQEAHGVDFYVYGVYASGDPKVCPSFATAMACIG